MKHQQIITDPCKYFCWDELKRLAICISWVDENQCTGKEEVMLWKWEKIKEHMEVDDFGNLTKYVVWNLDFYHKNVKVDPSGSDPKFHCQIWIF